MRSRCKARAKINRRRIFDTLRINFCEATPQMPSDVQKQTRSITLFATENKNYARERMAKRSLTERKACVPIYTSMASG